MIISILLITILVSNNDHQYLNIKIHFNTSFSQNVIHSFQMELSPLYHTK